MGLASVLIVSDVQRLGKRFNTCCNVPALDRAPFKVYEYWNALISFLKAHHLSNRLPSIHLTISERSQTMSWEGS